MLVSIQPKSMFIPGLGNVTANLLLVKPVNHELGVSCSSFWQLYTRAGEVDTPLPLSGNCDLTPEQFDAWGRDDDWFARCIAQNLGLFPISPA